VVWAALGFHIHTGFQHGVQERKQLPNARDPLMTLKGLPIGFEPGGTFSPPNPPSFPAAVLAADVRSLLLRVTENPIWDRHFSADAGWKVRFLGFG